MSYSLLNLGDGRFELSGKLDLSNVGEALFAGQDEFIHHGIISVDLAAADCASTAGMALLLEWSTWCAANEKRLAFLAVPGRLVELARLNDVEQLLHFPDG